MSFQRTFMLEGKALGCRYHWLSCESKGWNTRWGIVTAARKMSAFGELIFFLCLAFPIIKTMAKNDDLLL